MKDILYTGLEFTPINEKDYYKKVSNFSANHLCFTEMPLSGTAVESFDNHNDRYGYLGIGIHRKYIIRNFGNPVFYIEKKNESTLVKKLIEIWHKNNDPIIGKYLANIKPMGKESQDNYYNYDDLEWRIILDKEIIGKIDNKDADRPPDIIFKNNNHYLKLRRKLEEMVVNHHYPDEEELIKCIECIIFPHENILYKSIGMLEEFFYNYKYNNIPILTTVNRIKHL